MHTIISLLEFYEATLMRFESDIITARSKRD